MPLNLETAFPSTIDRTSYSALLSRIYEAEFNGRRPPAHPRTVIADSWARLRRRGVHPERKPSAPPPHSLETDTSELDDDAQLLASLIRANSRHLESLAGDDAALLASTDRHGRVIDRAGGRGMLARADELGFIQGAPWGENSVGTNSIGTALAARHAVQVHGAEHYSRWQHRWSCSSALVRDPRTGRTLGTVTLASDIEEANPMSLGLVSLLSHAVVQDLRERHQQDLAELRTASFSTTRALTSPWLVVDRWGWVADSHGAHVGHRVSLPRDVRPGDSVPTATGEVTVEELETGYLLGPVRTSGSSTQRTPQTTATITPTETGALVELRGATGRREVHVPARQADILLLLAADDQGLTAPELSTRIYGTPEHDVTVRAEISRLRRHLGDVLIASPYRFAPGITVMGAH